METRQKTNEYQDISCGMVINKVNDQKSRN